MTGRKLALAGLALIFTTSAGLHAAALPHQSEKAAPSKLPPLPAATVLKKAQTEAKATGKNVLVVFHASWCKWCHRLEGFMADDRVKGIFRDNLVPVHLTVMESADKKRDENAGGMDVMTALGGTKAGLPFFVILDSEGRPVISSIRPPTEGDSGGNIGFPAAPEEIEHFLRMLKAGAPKATEAQLAVVKLVLSEKPESTSAGG